MKTVLCSLNASFTHSCLALYAMKAEISSDQNVKIREYNINQKIETIIDELFELNADIYGFSCYIWNIELTIKVARTLKKLTNCVIVLGGSEVAFTPYESLERYKEIDYVVSGEGEAIMNDFIRLIENRKSPTALQGVYSKNNNAQSMMKSSFTFENRHFPYTKEILDSLQDKILYYESSRGCPYNCSYCISQIDKQLRYIPIETVEKELMFFMEHQVKQVKFIDRTFNSDDKRAIKIIRFILNHNQTTKFHFEICTEKLSAELISLFNSAPAGYFQLETGLQSINPDTLAAVNRNNDLSKFKLNLTALIKPQNIHIHADLIAALPMETYESFKQCFNYLYNLKPHMLQLGFLKILKGTQIAAETELYGIEYEDYPPYETLRTNTMNHAEIIKLKKIEYLLDKYYNSGLFNFTLNLLTNLFQSPFDFYENFSSFFDHNGFYNRPLSRKDLYSALSDLIIDRSVECAKTLLIFDYLKNNALSLPEFLLTDAKMLKKEKLFDFLKNEVKTIDYPREYQSYSIKEIAKKIIIIQLKFHPERCTPEVTTVLFLQHKENSVYQQNMHILLDNALFKPDDFF